MKQFEVTGILALQNEPKVLRAKLIKKIVQEKLRSFGREIRILRINSQVAGILD